MSIDNRPASAKPFRCELIMLLKPPRELSSRRTGGFQELLYSDGDINEMTICVRVRNDFI